jgi:hypothetical protein
MSRHTQEDAVIEALRRNGGYATLRRLNESIDFSSWRTKTPEASVRRIVQNSGRIFKIRPGLWALEEFRETVLRQFDIQPGNRESEERFSHGYYQGLLTEIGRFKHYKTYVPAQDRNRRFLGSNLGDMSDMTTLPPFSYDNLTRRAKSVDVIWFNERRMPYAFYEVEHTTDIKNSLSKFYELQDFHSGFFIVADISRKREFEDKLHASLFKPIENRVRFLDYSRIVGMYEGMRTVDTLSW